MARSLLASFAVCMALGGCETLQGTLHVSWDASTCAADDSIAADGTRDSSSHFEKTFPCPAGMGDVVLDTGTWSVTLSLVDPDGEVDGGETFTSIIHENQVAALTGFTLPTGRFSLTWTLTMGGAPADCEADGATTVRVTSTRLGCTSSCATLDTFPCSAMSGMTESLDEGDYDVTVDLLDMSGQNLLSLTSIETYHLVAQSDTDLGNYGFPF